MQKRRVREIIEWNDWIKAIKIEMKEKMKKRRTNRRTRGQTWELIITEKKKKKQI